MNDKIRAARKEAGYSQVTLAAILGLSKGAVAQWELGDTTPTLPNLIELAVVTGKSLNYFDKDAKPDEIGERVRTADEAILLRFFRRIDQKEQGLWLKIILTAGAPRNGKTNPKFRSTAKKKRPQKREHIQNET